MVRHRSHCWSGHWFARSKTSLQQYIGAWIPRNDRDGWIRGKYGSTRKIQGSEMGGFLKWVMCWICDLTKEKSWWYHESRCTCFLFCSKDVLAIATCPKWMIQTRNIWQIWSLITGANWVSTIYLSDLANDRLESSNSRSTSVAPARRNLVSGSVLWKVSRWSWPKAMVVWSSRMLWNPWGNLDCTYCSIIWQGTWFDISFIRSVRIYKNMIFIRIHMNG